MQIWGFGVKSIRKQLMLVIVIAVASVIVSGRMIEQANPFKHEDVVDVDLIGQRAVTLSYLLDTANTNQRQHIIDRSAEVGIDLEIIKSYDLNRLPEPEGFRSKLGAFLAHMFPPDDALPNGARVRIINQRPVLTMPINKDEVLLYRAFPNSIISQDFAGALLYYLLSFITLSVLFSVFAVRYLTTPLTEISSQIGDTEAFLSQKTPLKENGSLEIARLARMLNDMRARIQDMIRNRTDMLRSVSHDLRTPLTRIRLRVERIGDTVLREQILTDIQQLNAMIDSTLDYLRDDRGNETVERTDIASIMQTICDDFSDVGAKISYSGPVRLIWHCKPMAITRAIANLCDNGLKFGSEIEMTLIGTSQSLCIEVHDNGPGIPEEFKQSVLEPFFQIDAARTKKSKLSGFGLGLSIVDEIVHDHAGRIELEDNVPQGLTVRLIFPVRT